MEKSVFQGTSGQGSSEDGAHSVILASCKLFLRFVRYD